MTPALQRAVRLEAESGDGAILCSGPDEVPTPPEVSCVEEERECFTCTLVWEADRTDWAHLGGFTEISPSPPPPSPVRPLCLPISSRKLTNGGFCASQPAFLVLHCHLHSLEVLASLLNAIQGDQHPHFYPLWWFLLHKLEKASKKKKEKKRKEKEIHQSNSSFFLFKNSSSGPIPQVGV